MSRTSTCGVQARSIICVLSSATHFFELQNVSCDYDRWVVETQLCKLCWTYSHHCQIADMKPSKGPCGTENFGGFVYVLDRFPQRDFGLRVFMCTTILSLFCVPLSGYHAEGYHAPSLPPRAITPVYTSRLSHQSYHAPPQTYIGLSHPLLVIRILLFTFWPASTPPVLLLLHHHRAPHVPTYSTR